MTRWCLVLSALVLLTCFTVMADDDDRVMGVYEGGFDDSGANLALRAQVVGEGKFQFRAVLFVGQSGQAEERVEIKGKGKDGVASFNGDSRVNALGGQVAISGDIRDQVFKGTVKAGRKTLGFTLRRVFPEPPTRGMAPPEGAIVLYNGGDPVTNWVRVPEAWCAEEDGSMAVCGSSLMTRQALGSGTYHVEFMTPYMPTERYQGRGNSGVYILGRYEIQVLDSFGTPPAWDLCGGIYKQAVPLVDAVLPPLQWQTYDITFTAPRFDEKGNKTANARITVVHNGKVIHDNLELTGPTPGGLGDNEVSEAPLMLQDHGNRVKYRNIWYVPAK
ncbi:MAG TPA: DUF1080 domain-containing protein [Candidatus Hydrogenedentes bacterium]|nr:DUF1080 domain-containing protein [Candidatus Hydrogenedentota bacterium]HOK90437.1 DUF1080 domain-containing protein [Candidatus Hydrogenedentota bacterium]